MPVTDQTPIGNAVGNGVATVYPFDYYVADDDDLVVQVDGVPKTLNVDYSLTGVGNEEGGQIVFTAPPASGAQISHFRDTALTRDTDYQTTGDLFANVVDFDFDRLWLALQEIFGGGKAPASTLRVPNGETVPALPRRAQRINKLLLFDSNGDPYVAAPVSGSAADVLLQLAAPDGGALVGFRQNGLLTVARTMLAKARDIKHVNDWGGDLKKALQDVAEWTTIVLDAANYDISGLYSSDFNFGAGPFVGNTKRGVRLQGANMPRVNSTGTALEGGTVIQGTLLNLAADFEAYDLGVDVGDDVCAAKYGGAYAEGFVPGCNTAYPTVQATIKGVCVDRVIALGRVPTGSSATYKHTMLFENMEDTKIGMIEAVGGYHAFVSKVINLQANSIMARGGAAGEAVIFKSDVANRCEDNQIANLRIDNWFKNGVEQKAGCLRFEAIDNVNSHITSKIKIGVCTIKNLAAGVDGIQASGTFPIVDCGIGHLNVDTATSSVAALRMGYSGADIRRFVIGSHNIVTAGRSFELGAGWVEGHIGSGSQKFTADALQPLMSFASSSYTHGVIQMTIDVAQTNTYMIQRSAGDVRIDLITFGGGALIPSTRYLSSYGGTFTINATNAVDSGTPAFGVAGIEYVPYKVKLKGAVKTLTAGSKQLFTVSPAPLVTIRRTVNSQTAAAAFVTRTLEFTGGTGVCTVLDAAVTANDFIFLDEVKYNPLTR